MMVRSRLRRLLKLPLLRDKRGVSAVEFGMTAPILFIVVFGTLQQAQSYYCYTVLNGAVNAAARKSSLQSGQTSATTLDTLVTQMIKYVMPQASVTFTRKTIPILHRSASRKTSPTRTRTASMTRPNASST